jgi:hypothetical protein
MSRCLLQGCINPKCETHQCKYKLQNEEFCGSKYHREQHHNGACNDNKCKFCRDIKRNLYPNCDVVITNIRCGWCGAEFDHDMDNCYFNPLSNLKEDQWCNICNIDDHSTESCYFYNKPKNPNNTKSYKLTQKPSKKLYSTINPNSVTKQNYGRQYEDHMNDENLLRKQLNVQNHKYSRYKNVHGYTFFYVSDTEIYFLAGYRNVQDKIPTNNNFGKLWNQGGGIDHNDCVLKTLLKESREEAGVDISHADQIIQFELNPPKTSTASFLNIFYTKPIINGPDVDHINEVKQNKIKDFKKLNAIDYINGVSWVSINELQNACDNKMPNVYDSFVVNNILDQIYPLLMEYVNDYKSTHS